MYRLISLAEDCTTSSNAKGEKDTTNLNGRVAKVNVPTLPEFSTEIYVDPNEMESIIGDKITVCVVDDKLQTMKPKINNKR